MESWELLTTHSTEYLFNLFDEDKGVEGTDPRCSKSQITMLVLTIIGFLCYVFLLVVTVRFCRNVGLYNKWLLLSFLSFNGSLIWKICFFISTYVSFLKDCSPINRWEFAAEIFTADFLLQCGVLLGLCNWYHIIIKVNNYLSVVKSSINPKIKFIRIIAISIVSLLFILFIFQFILSWNSNNASFEDIDNFFRWGRWVIFLSLSLAWIILGANLNILLSKIMIKDLKSLKLRLIISIILVSCPLISKSVFNIVWILFDLRQILVLTSVKENDLKYPIYNLIYFIFTDLFPMAAQIIWIKTAIVHFDNDQMIDENSYSSVVNEFSIWMVNNSQKTGTTIHK